MKTAVERRQASAPASGGRREPPFSVARPARCLRAGMRYLRLPAFYFLLFFVFVFFSSLPGLTRWSMLSPRLANLTVNRAAPLHGLPDQVGNDDVKKLSRGAFFASEFCQTTTLDTPRHHRT